MAPSGSSESLRLRRPVSMAGRVEPAIQSQVRRSYRLPDEVSQAGRPKPLSPPVRDTRTGTRAQTRCPIGEQEPRWLSAFEAAGQGLEPRLPDPESGVLPLDDPATGRHCTGVSSDLRGGVPPETCLLAARRRGRPSRSRLPPPVRADRPCGTPRFARRRVDLLRG